MAYTNNRFKGYIEGRSIYDYSGKLDYKVEKLDKRLEEVSKILNLNEDGNSKDKFWEEIWDMGICKAGLNTTDNLWSDTNVSKCLEDMGTYLLSKAPKEDNPTIRVYDDYELFKRILKEKELIGRYGEKEDDDIVIFKTKKNYKLDPKESIKSVDRNKYDELIAYYEFKQYLLSLSYNGKDDNLKKDSENKRKALIERINTTSKTEYRTTNSKIYQLIKRQLPMVEDDMLHIKLSKERPIRWKSPLKDSISEVDWDYLDMFNPEHVKPLLQVKNNRDISNDMLITLGDLLDKVQLNDRQKEILEMWKEDKTQQYISDELGICQSNLKKQLDKIVKKVIDIYEKEYEENYYYLNILKGKYKKCSKCGEIKLIQRFDKKGKQGLHSQCKECRKG